MIEAQVLVEIVREKTLFRKSAHFVEVQITLQRNVSKKSDRKRKNLARLMLRKTEERKGHLKTNLDVDLKITRPKPSKDNEKRLKQVSFNEKR